MTPSVLCSMYRVQVSTASNKSNKLDLTDGPIARHVFSVCSFQKSSEGGQPLSILKLMSALAVRIAASSSAASCNKSKHVGSSQSQFDHYTLWV